MNILWSSSILLDMSLALLSRARFLIALVSAGAVMTFAATALSQPGIVNGYGYGYGTCSAEKPSGLTATAQDKNRRLVLSWNAVTFADCATAVADRYQLQVRHNAGLLVQSYASIRRTEKTITLKALRRNHSYKFRVRAVAVDDSTSSWSNFKLFRTAPKRPAAITITALSSRAIHATWRNVTRSERLQYYQVVVKRKNRVVSTKKVRIGLRKTKTGIVIRRLRPATAYTILVRAVANKTTASSYSSQRFTMPAE